MSQQQPTVTRNDEAHRYEIHLGDVLAGFSEFERDDAGRLVFPHTEVDPSFSGQGLGGTLVGEAMADAASQGETVVPTCPFVAKYIREHEIDALAVHWPDEADGEPSAPGEQDA